MLDLHGFGNQLLIGTGITLLVAACSVALGLVFGLAGAVGKLSSSRVGRETAEIYTSIIRGVPELLVLLIAFFGGTTALTALVRGLGIAERAEVSAFGAGVFGLGLVFGAYATEVLRGAVQAIPRGQIEAAKACGMNRLLIFRRILVPQVLRLALPGLGNLWLVLLKDSSLVSIVGLQDLMFKTSRAAQATKEPFTFYFAAALIYLALTAVSSGALQKAEAHVSRGVRRA